MCTPKISDLESPRAAGQPASSWTLSDLLRHLARDQLADRDPKTIADKLSTVAWWQELTRDPPLSWLSQDDVGQFRLGLLAEIGEGDRQRQARSPQRLLFDIYLDQRQGRKRRPIKSRATVNRHLRNLQNLLYLAGPPGPKHPDAIGALQDVPYVRKVKQLRPQPNPLRDDELRALYAACDAMTAPVVEGFAAPAWWRAFLIAGLTTGLRVQSLLGIRWRAIDWPARMLYVEASIDKCDRAQAQPIHRELAKHLLPIRRDDDQPIFPWPLSPRALSRHWNRLERAAGLRTHHTPHDLKDSFGTRLAAAGAGAHQIQGLLHHKSLTTSRHYVDLAGEQLRGPLDRMPLPDFSDDEEEPKPDAGAG